MFILIFASIFCWVTKAALNSYASLQDLKLIVNEHREKTLDESDIFTVHGDTYLPWSCAKATVRDMPKSYGEAFDHKRMYMGSFLTDYADVPSVWKCDDFQSKELDNPIVCLLSIARMGSDNSKAFCHAFKSSHQDALEFVCEDAASLYINVNSDDIIQDYLDQTKLKDHIMNIFTINPKYYNFELHLIPVPPFLGPSAAISDSQEDFVFLGYHGTSRAALRHLTETPFRPQTFFTTDKEHAMDHASGQGLCHLFAPKSELDQWVFLIPEFMSAEIPCSSMIKDFEELMDTFMNRNILAFNKNEDSDALVLLNGAETKIIQVCQDLGVYETSLSEKFSPQSIWNELLNRPRSQDIYCLPDN